MIKPFWKFIFEHLWPILWPIFRELIVNFVKDLIAWIKQAIMDMIQKSAKQQQASAEAEAKMASERAESAGNQEDKTRAEAEAATWQKVVEMLKADNEHLKAELARVMNEAEQHAEEQIQSEKIKNSARDQVLSLPPPK